MRKCHYLREDKTTTTPSHCVYFDTESVNRPIGKNKLEHMLTFGWACYRRKRTNGQWTTGRWFRFTDPKDFYTWIDSITLPKTKLYLFCHNTNFDLPLTDFFNNMKAIGYDLVFACIDAPPTICTMTRDKHKIVALDSLNFFRMPLKDIGKHVGLEKYDMPDVSVKSKEADRYCKRDVEIVYTAIEGWFKFLEDHDMGSFSNTVAGQSMKAFRHRFMPCKILIDDNEKATALSRRAYYGGRTECFYIGKLDEPLYLLDVNSMYPSVMRDNLMPVKIRTHRKNISVDKLKSFIDDYAVCADLTIETDIPVYPIRQNNKLIFPKGRFRTCLSTPEIKYLFHTGKVIEVHEASVYQKADIFSDYVNELYLSRQQAQARGDDVQALIFKLLLNSLYGKTGQKGQIWDGDMQIDDLSAACWVEINAKTGVATSKRKLAGLVQTLSGEQESRESFPAIAAHVTAHARLLLYGYINQAGRENVFYVDTDSLLVNESGYRRLSSAINSATLGMLKLEGQFTNGQIWGLKDYRFDNKERHKGVKKNAVWLSESKVQQDQWSSLRGILREGRLDKPTIKTIEKNLKREYNKGDVTPWGQVLPIRMTG